MSSQHNLVISGISGRFPESSNCAEFMENLYSGVDMITNDDRRWPPGLYGAPSRTGKIKDVASFDAEFFGIHSKLANVMDPQLRMLLEVTYEAIMDAGYNPEELRGTKTGVYIGLMTTEANDYSESTPEKLTGYETIGSTRAMLANRLSYAFDFSGPCCTIDTACSSALFGLHLAVTAINNGECDHAIIGGVNLTLKPATSLMYHKYSMLSPTGTISPFDVSANGYVRSESVAVIFVTKDSFSRRIYAQVVGTSTNTDGFKKQGQTYPLYSRQAELMKTVYNKCNVDPADVGYVEAHGTGTSVGDVQETRAITEIFCQNRKTPLLIGSVKSNCGHTEPVSGLVSIAKCIFTFETGLLPGNINFKNPNPNIIGLQQGKLKVVDKVQPLLGDYFAINSFGVGGTNAHVLLKRPHVITMSPKIPISSLEPRLIVAAGRTKDSVKSLLSELLKSKNEEFIRMYDQIHSIPTPGFSYRGFAIRNSQEMDIQQCDPQRRPIWFLFSGMGSQWLGMGRELLQNEEFSKSIERCDTVLRPMNVSLRDLYENPNENDFQNPVNVMTGIIGMQIALVNVLKSVGVEPDGIFGHSIGELSCSYADGGFTLEETILAAYWRGSVLVEAKPIKGAMVAVGLGWDEINRRLPNGIVAACHNSKDSVTISGPQDEVRQFVKKLHNENIFAKEVDSLGYAFHSPYLATAAKILRSKLESFINTESSERRTTRWISTSYEEKDWKSDHASKCSSEYHLHNVLSPVLFQQALDHIPANAIIIEIAPHPLLQAILKRSLPGTVARVTLTNKHSNNAITTLLTGIGSLYTNGIPIQLRNLYGSVIYPVPRGTPMISPTVKWDHSTQYKVPSFISKDSSGENSFDISLKNESDRSLQGHNINGRVLYPAAGYITLVWKVISKTKNEWFENVSVQFEDVEFLKPTVLIPDGEVTLKVTILSSSGLFEITENDTAVVKGMVKILDEQFTQMSAVPDPSGDNLLQKSDIYKELKLRGYCYEDIYQGISFADIEGTQGKVSWNNDWISFIDTCLQFRLISLPHRDLRLPTKIKRVVIHPKIHKQYLSQGGQNISYNAGKDTVQTNGVEIYGMEVTQTSKRETQPNKPSYEIYEFCKYFSNTEEANNNLLEESVLEILLGMAMENIYEDRLKVLDLANLKLSLQMKNIIEREPHKSVEMFTHREDLEDPELKLNNIKVVKDISNGFCLKEEDKFHVVICNQMENFRSELLKNESPSFLINIYDKKDCPSDTGVEFKEDVKNYLREVSRYATEERIYSLESYNRSKTSALEEKFIEINSNSFEWLPRIHHLIKNKDETKDLKLVLISEGAINGVVALVKCLNQEYGGSGVQFRCLSLETPNTLLTQEMINKQLSKNLCFNVYKDGDWGSYRHRRLPVQVSQNEGNAQLTFQNNSPKWIQIPDLHTESDNVCTVKFVSTIETHLGSKHFQFSGINISSGKFLMGFTRDDIITKTCHPDEYFTWEVPNDISLEEAVGFPLIYGSLLTYGLENYYLSAGDHVLIDISSVSSLIAIEMICNIFKEVSCTFLIYDPSLEALVHTHYSTFSSNLIIKTNLDDIDDIPKQGLLFNVIISSNSSLLNKMSQYLCKGGLLLNIDGSTHEEVKFVPEIQYVHVTYDLLFKMKNPDKQRNRVKTLIHNIINRPLPQALYPLGDLPKIRSVTFIPTFSTENTTEITQFKRRIFFDPNKSYIVLGGLGGFGLELCEWMVQRRCRNLVISSRNGIQNAYQQYFINRWRNLYQVNVQISTSIITNKTGVNALLNTAASRKPIDGIFNLAGVLRDGMFENQTEENFELVFSTKVKSTLLFDQITRDMGLDLTYFVTFSSITSGRGNKGQSNYGLANSCMEQICNQRREKGLSGMAIQWGPIADVGMAAKLIDQNRNKIIGGAHAQSIQSCLESLDVLLSSGSSVTASTIIPNKTNANDDGNSENVTIKKVVADILGIQDVSRVSDEATLSALGLDSLMTADVKNVLQTKFNINLPNEQIKELKFNQMEALVTK